MRVVITGAGSFLGRHTAEELKKRGHETVLLKHSFEEEPEKLPSSADAWIHFAWAGQGPGGRALSSIQDYNIEMSVAALYCAERLGAKRFLFAGSQAEYGRVKIAAERSDQGLSLHGLINEAHACRPVSEYAKAKLFFSELAKKSLYAAELEDDFGVEGDFEANAVADSEKVSRNGMNFLHLRIFSVYGEGDRESSLISSAMTAFSQNKPMELSDCSQFWNYLYIKDCARAVAIALENFVFPKGSRYEILNIGGEDIRPLRSYVEELRELLGSSSELLFGSRAQNLEGASDLAPDISKLKALGFSEEYSFSEGIGEMLNDRYKR